MRAAARADAGDRRALDHRGFRRSPTCASIQRLLARPAPVGRRVEVSAGQREITRHLPGHGRDRLPTPAALRRRADDHRPRSPATARGRSRHPAASRGRDPSARALRRPDPGMSKTSELAHIFRALKTPAAARAIPKLASRAREESWSHERFLEACSRPRSPRASPTVARTASRPRASRPERHSRNSTSPSSARSRKTVIEHLGQLDFLHGKENVVMLGPPGPARPTWRSRSASAPAWPASGWPLRPRPSGSQGWVRPSATATSRQELARLGRIPLLVVDEVGYIPFDPESANLMFA